MTDLRPVRSVEERRACVCLGCEWQGLRFPSRASDLPCPKCQGRVIDKPRRVWTIDNFFANVVKTPDGCWEWVAGRSSQGYGRVYTGEKTQNAHRVSYEMTVGPIPEGLVLDHLCRNPPCVNPAHLEPVTNRENILRGEGHAARNAAKTHCPRGHELAGANLGLSKGRRYCCACKRERWREQSRG